jgi:RNA polymerase sigma factor (sigma-70 family)
MTDTEKIVKLRTDDRYFTKVYNEHRDYALRFMSKIHKDHDEIQDVYQDAVLVLLENARKEEFKLTCNIQTYLNSICRNQLLTKHRKNSKMHTVNMEDFDPNINDWFSDHEFNPEKEERLNTLESAMELFKQQSKKCFDLLSMQYFEKKRMDNIAKLLGFSNDKSAKSQAAKCRGELRKLVQSSYA